MPLSNNGSTLVFETVTAYGHYQVWDTIYGGRPARVLYSGQRRTAQSGVARDGQPHLLFDYNQRLFELAAALEPARLLLIGGGVYTLPMALLQTLPSVKIDVVEIDEALDELAERFFDFRPNPRLRVFHADGRRFLDTSSDRYDMIFVDAFLQDVTPGNLETPAAIKAYLHHLNHPGLLARNLISAYHGLSAHPLHHQLRDYKDVFGNVAVYPAGDSMPLGLPQNLVLISQTGRVRPLGNVLRYPALEEPDIRP
jgi:spermidine synthase